MQSAHAFNLKRSFGRTRQLMIFTKLALLWRRLFASSYELIAQRISKPVSRYGERSLSPTNVLFGIVQGHPSYRDPNTDQIRCTIRYTGFPLVFGSPQCLLSRSHGGAASGSVASTCRFPESHALILFLALFHLAVSPSYLRVRRSSRKPEQK